MREGLNWVSLKHTFLIGGRGSQWGVCLVFEKRLKTALQPSLKPGLALCPVPGRSCLPLANLEPAVFTWPGGA